MCGIAGFTSFFSENLRTDDVIREMTSLLATRGPDDLGVSLQPEIAMGHRRLSIIDIERGSQPMSIDGGRFTAVCDGRIFNHIELRSELESRGCSFRTNSDIEVLLRQYAIDGAECLQRLNGIFALAIWDSELKRLFLARDRVGLKPLYYALAGRDLVFASELKALLKHPGVVRTLNPLSVSKYLTYGYIPAPHTIFKGINKLEPGNFLSFDSSGLHKSLYWDIPLEDNPVSVAPFEECSEQLLRLLADSVKIQTRGDVPVGVLLSGGLDSSAITALAAELSGSKLKTFSVGFDESSYDESPFAERVAKLFGCEHHHETLSAKKALELIPDVMQKLDEPFGDASVLPTWMLSRHAARHVKAVLSGDGGDELFMGYPSFQAHRAMEKITILPAAWRAKLIKLARKLPVSHRYASLNFLAQQFFKGAGVSPEIRFFLWMGAYGNEQKKDLLTAEFQEQLLRSNPFEDIVNYIKQSGLTHDLERLQYLCMKLYLQDGVLVKVDRASMAHGLEVRAPFLDHDVVEFMSSIHSSYKLRGLKTKFLLKKAMAKRLPKSIVNRRKAGFMVPLASWLSGDLRCMLEEYCSESALRADGIFNPSFTKQLLDDHFEMRKDNRKMIWTLLAFQIWKQHYL